MSTTWNNYDAFSGRGRTFKTRARRYKDCGTYLAVVSGAFLTAGALKMSISSEGGIVVVKEFKFQ
jgi:hypothetical protein